MIETNNLNVTYEVSKRSQKERWEKIMQGQYSKINSNNDEEYFHAQIMNMTTKEVVGNERKRKRNCFFYINRTYVWGEITKREDRKKEKCISWYISFFVWIEQNIEKR